jgi:GNAT superfamily N-acetyltransferase
LRQQLITLRIESGHGVVGIFGREAILALPDVIKCYVAMNGALRIRQARPDDLPQLQELYHHLDADDIRCSPDEAAAVFQQFLRYPGSAILVDTVGDELAASCSLVVIPNLTRAGRPYALIENVVTHADWRNRGYGSAVLKAATERAWDRGCYKVSS